MKNNKFRKLTRLTLAVLIISAMLLPGFSSLAAGTPPTSISAPINLGAANHMGNSINCTLSAPDDLRTLMDTPEKDRGYSMGILGQVDFKVDNGSWHYSADWDNPATYKKYTLNYYNSLIGKEHGQYLGTERLSFKTMFPNDTNVPVPAAFTSWDWYKTHSMTLRARFAVAFGKSVVFSDWSKEYVLSGASKMNYKKIMNDNAPTILSSKIVVKGVNKVPWVELQLGQHPTQVQKVNAAVGNAIWTEVWFRKQGDTDFKKVGEVAFSHEKILLDVSAYLKDKSQNYAAQGYEVKVRYKFDERAYQQSGQTKMTYIYSPYSNVLAFNMLSQSNASTTATSGTQAGTQTAVTFTKDTYGVKDGYLYRMERAGPVGTSMTITSGGAFSCQWSNASNSVFERGLQLDRSKTYSQLGEITCTYSAVNQVKDGTYCSYFYANTNDTEYWIIEDFSNWPLGPDAIKRGTVTIDGGTYDMYEQISGWYKSYYNVRTVKRTSGTISVNKHLDKWRSLGAQTGGLSECSLMVRAFSGSGSCDVTSNTITIIPPAPPAPIQVGSTITKDASGGLDGYYFKMYAMGAYGNSSMTLNSGGAFSCQWSQPFNLLFRRGLHFDNPKPYSQLGDITCTYSADYQAINGASDLSFCVYTDNSICSIIESSTNWNPVAGTPKKGTVTIDGSTYDIYERIINNTQKEVYSIRTVKRTSGTISVTKHLAAWESLGIQNGRLSECSLEVDAISGDGSCDVSSNVITITQSSTPASTP